MADNDISSRDDIYSLTGTFHEMRMVRHGWKEIADPEWSGSLSLKSQLYTSTHFPPGNAPPTCGCKNNGN